MIRENEENYSLFTVSDTKSIINSERDENQSIGSNEVLFNRQNSYTNPVMSVNDENDILITNSNYGSICGINRLSVHKQHIDISREVIDFDDLSRSYGKVQPQRRTVGKRIKKGTNDCLMNCSLLALLFRLFPIFDWIRSYSIKEYLFSDVIAGFTILILHIPQGMAYGMLSGLEPINGLYVSFFPVLVYALMGTSKHLSIGTFAIISIMSSNAAEKLGSMPGLEGEDDIIGFHMNATTLAPGAQADYTTLEVLTSLCILTGIFQALMGCLRLGALSVILSDTLVSSFSTGCAIHVATSQLSSLFDIVLPKNKTYFNWLPFKLINQWISIGEQLAHTNLVTLGLSIFGMLLLIVVKELIEPKVKKRFSIKIPIPIDILLVIGFTVFSWAMKLNTKYDVEIMSDIPTGLPHPQLPRLDLLPSIVVDSLVIAIVAYAVSLSLAKIYAKKHKYSIDANQELIALGCANIFSSLFACYPSSASLSRSSVQESSGGRTQVAGLVSSLFMLVFLLFLGPLLYHLPKTTLSCIILIALKSMFLQFGDFVQSWKVSKIEAMQWLVTFVAVILLGVDIGLIVGVIFSLLTVLFRFTVPKSSINGRLAFTEIYVDSDVFREAKQIPGLKIFQFHCPLFFMNTQNFKRNLYKKALKLSNNEMKTLTDSDIMNQMSCTDTIILDFSSIFFIDSAGVDTIVEVIQELEDIHIKVVICSCSSSVIQMFEKMNFFAKVTTPTICATVHDGVVLSLGDHRLP